VFGAGSGLPCAHRARPEDRIEHLLRRQVPARLLRAIRDERVKAEITRVWRDNFEVYGAEKAWLELNWQGITVARCTVQRLMRELGIAGASAAGRSAPPSRAGRAAGR
jgi:transposase InsO family protein